MLLCRGTLAVDWEDWAETAKPFDGPGLTVLINYVDKQPPPVVRLGAEETRALRDYLNALALDQSE